MSRLIDADELKNKMAALMCDGVNLNWSFADVIDRAPSAQPPVLTCDGCRHVGTYDTDFPCSGCIRREKDYYEQER